MELDWRDRNTIGKERWDRFVGKSEEGWLWHCFDFQDALACWPNYSDVSFGVLDPDSGGDLIAIVPSHLLAGDSVSSLGGAALSDKIPGRLKSRALNFVRDHWVDTAKRHQVPVINISLAPMAPAYSGERCPRVNPLVEFGCENRLTQTWVLDLRPGKEALWKQMEGRARTAVRKSLKSGAKVREAGPDDLEEYYRLHTETYRRTGLTPHSKKYFETIWMKFLSKKLAHILMAEWNGEIVAAENFGTYKRRAIYWTGAASDMGLSIEANSLIQWTAMQWMVDNGFEFYETGEAFPAARTGKNKGLNDFKKSFGGALYPFYKGTLVLGDLGPMQARKSSRLGERLMDLSLKKIIRRITK